MAVDARTEPAADPVREDRRVRLRAKERLTYRVTFRPEPGVDGIRALRALLKSSLRRFGLRCIQADQE
jgi:hypothetical protein